MQSLKTVCWLVLALSFGCRSTTQAPAAVADQVSGPTFKTPLELTIKPAAAAVAGGQRVPLRFTIRNAGDQTVRACLSSGRVVHLWGIDREYAYTVTEQSADRSPCEETLDLEPHADHSWNDEMTIPPIASSSAKIVGFALLHEGESCGQEPCKSVWLSATYAPLTIQGAAKVSGPLLDLRTGAKSAAALTTIAAPGPGHP